jgi:small nuclear ribonucleoprotein (snRNP)-like protein
MKYSEIYKNLSWKDKINYKKIIMSTQNNLIIIIGNVKQCEAYMNK